MRLYDIRVEERSESNKQSREIIQADTVMLDKEWENKLIHV